MIQPGQTRNRGAAPSPRNPSPTSERFVSEDLRLATTLASFLVLLPSIALADADADGYSVANGDCDDADPSVHPYAIEFFEASRGAYPKIPEYTEVSLKMVGCDATSARAVQSTLASDWTALRDGSSVWEPGSNEAPVLEGLRGASIEPYRRWRQHLIDLGVVPSPSKRPPSTSP